MVSSDQHFKEFSLGIFVAIQKSCYVVKWVHRWILYEFYCDFIVESRLNVVEVPKNQNTLNIDQREAPTDLDFQSPI